MRKSVLILLSLLLFINPLVLNWSLMESFYLPKKFCFEFFLYLSVGIYIFHSLKKEKHSFFITPLHIPFVLFFCWITFSLLKSVNLFLSLNNLILQLEYLLLFCVSLYLTARGERIMFLINALILSGMFVSIIAIGQYFGLDILHGLNIKSGYLPLDKDDIYSTLGHPNFMGSFLVGIYPFSLLLIFSHKSRRRYFYVLSAILIFMALLFSRSKGAWLGGGVSFLFLIYLLVRNKDYGRKIILTLGIIIFSMATYLSLSKVSPLSTLQETFSPHYPKNRARLLIWQTTLMMIEKNPFLGLGFGTYNLHYQRYQGDFLSKAKNLDYYLEVYKPGIEAHNDYLQLAAETGVVGLILFLIIIFRFFFHGFRMLGKKAGLISAEDQLIIIGALAGVIAILAHALIDFPLQQIPPSILFFIFMGLVMGMPFRTGNREGGFIVKEVDFSLKYFQDVPLVKVFFPLTILLILVSLTYRSAKPLIGSFYHLKAYDLMVKNEFERVVPLVMKGLRWYPLNSDLYLMLGAAYHYQGELSSAQSAYRNSFILRPDYKTLYDLGLVNMEMGNEMVAKDFFLEAIKYHPDMVEAYLELANIYRRERDEQKFAEYYAKGVEFQKKKRYNSKPAEY